MFRRIAETISYLFLVLRIAKDRIMYSASSLGLLVPAREHTGFHTVYEEGGLPLKNPFLSEVTVFNDLCPMPRYIKPFRGGDQSQHDLKSFINKYEHIA